MSFQAIFKGSDSMAGSNFERQLISNLGPRFSNARSLHNTLEDLPLERDCFTGRCMVTFARFCTLVVTR